MACSHKEAIDENTAVEEEREPELVVREWYPSPKRSIVQPGIATPYGQPGLMPSQVYTGSPVQQAPRVAAPRQQYVQPAPQQQYVQPAPQQQYVQPAPQQQYVQPAPQQQYVQPAPQQQYVQPVPQQQYVQPAPAYQYAPRPWGPQPQAQTEKKEQAPVQYNPWQPGVTVTPGWGAVPVYPGWGGPGIWAGAPP